MLSLNEVVQTPFNLRYQRPHSNYQKPQSTLSTTLGVRIPNPIRFVICGSGRIRTYCVSNVLVLQTSALPPSEQHSHISQRTLCIKYNKIFFVSFLHCKDNGFFWHFQIFLQLFFIFFFAGEPGLEPRPSDLEAEMLTNYTILLYWVEYWIWTNVSDFADRRLTTRPTRHYCAHEGNRTPTLLLLRTRS